MDVVLAVAEVGGVAEAAAGEVTLVAAGAAGVVALLNRAEGRADVFEFVVDVERNFAQTDDQTDAIVETRTSSAETMKPASSFLRALMSLSMRKSFVRGGC